MTDEEYAECVDSLVDRMKSTKYHSQSQSPKDDVNEEDNIYIMQMPNIGE